MDTSFGWAQLGTLIAFLTLFVGRTVQLGVGHRIRVLTLFLHKSRAEAMRELLLLVGFPLWIYLVAATAGPLDLPMLPPSVDPVLLSGVGYDLAGTLLATFAVAIFAWSLLSFGTSWRVGIDRRDPGVLVTHGAFGWSRNPIFLAMDCISIGAFLIAGNASLLAFAVILPTSLHKQIRQEESFLADRYGGAYDAYRTVVSRYFGRQMGGKMKA